MSFDNSSDGFGPFVGAEFEISTTDGEPVFAMTPYGVPLEAHVALSLDTKDLPEPLSHAEAVSFGAGEFVREMH